MRNFEAIPVYKVRPTHKRKNAHNLKVFEGRAGAYIIYAREHDEPQSAAKMVYIGSSATNVAKTILRHFQRWYSKSNNYPDRISYYYRARLGPKAEVFTVAVTLTTAEEAYELEKALIMKYQPADNRQKYERIKESLVTEQQQAPTVAASEFLPAEEVPF